VIRGERDLLKSENREYDSIRELLEREICEIKDELKEIRECQNSVQIGIQMSLEDKTLLDEELESLKKLVDEESKRERESYQ
jgi:microsomal dipeptidase-like Zn-dependent dipeptidase